MAAETVGLVLTGGGARAAYQVGALKALAELSPGGASPFRVLAGVSAGAINAAFLAARADDFPAAAESLRRTWSGLTPDRVFRTDAVSLFSIGSSLLRELSGGGWLGAGRVNHLLDTAPLRKLLERTLPLGRIQSRFKDGSLLGAAVSTTNYHTGTAITFYDSASPLPPWSRSMRLGLRERLTVEHIMASTAMPLFFPPVALRGAYYGDGCIRMTSPLSPAIHLGAEKIVAVGTRYPRGARETEELNCAACARPPALSEVGGALLNSVFLDSLEADAERLERVNRTLSLMTAEQRARLPSPLRPIPLLVLRPSRDLGALATGKHERLPRALRYLLRGTGVAPGRGADLVSYLAFEGEYLGRLLELGYQDTLARRGEIEAFFGAPSPAARTAR